MPYVYDLRQSAMYHIGGVLADPCFKRFDEKVTKACHDLVLIKYFRSKQIPDQYSETIVMKPGNIGIITYDYNRPTVALVRRQDYIRLMVGHCH